jgi:AcrR family transcriptional regulator
MKPLPKTRPRKLERQILDAAKTCFQENGIEGTTIEQIRAASGASNGSIYHHFGSKGAIALTLYVEGMQQYQNDILTRLKRETTAQGGVRAIITEHLKVVESDPDLSLFLTRAGLAGVPDDVAARIAEINREFFTVVHEWLRPFIENGEIIRLPAELYVPLILGPTTHIARHWLLHRLFFDLSEIAEPLAEAAWRSLRSDN